MGRNDRFSKPEQHHLRLPSLALPVPTKTTPSRKVRRKGEFICLIPAQGPSTPFISAWYRLLALD